MENEHANGIADKAIGIPTDNYRSRDSIPTRKSMPYGENTFMTLGECNLRHAALEAKVEKGFSDLKLILIGDPTRQDDKGGLLGEFRLSRQLSSKDRAWIYGIVTLLGIPTVLMFIDFIIGRI